MVYKFYIVDIQYNSIYYCGISRKLSIDKIIILITVKLYIRGWSTKVLF